MIMLMKTLIIENPRVGGSIPPLGTISFPYFDLHCSMAALRAAKILVPFLKNL